MKFVWPPLMKALDERAARIADGLAAADRGKAEMAAVEKRAAAIIEEAKKTASDEAARIIAAARAEAEQQVALARDELRTQFASLAVKGAEQILRREVNEKAHAELLKRLKSEL